MNTIQDIKGFLANEYEVFVNFFDNSCVVSYPGCKDSLVPRSECHYSIVKYSTDTTDSRYAMSVLRFNENGDKIKDIMINMPTYIFRTYIICDIVKSCVLIHYPYSLVQYKFKEQDLDQNAIFDILELPSDISDSKNIEKEEIIREIFLSGNYNTEEPYAHNTEGVEEGFMLLWNIFWEG